MKKNKMTRPYLFAHMKPMSFYLIWLVWILICACTHRPPTTPPALTKSKPITSQRIIATPSLMSVVEESSKNTNDQGLTLHFQSQKNSHLSSLQLWVKAGSQQESTQQMGLAYLTQHMLLDRPQANLGQPSLSLRQALENMGAHVKNWVSKDRSVIEILCLTEQIPSVMSLVSKAITQVQWRAADMNQVIKKVKHTKHTNKSQIKSNHLNHLLQLAYGKHPNGHPIVNDLAMIKNFTIQDVRTFYQNYYHPTRAHLIYLGSIEEEAMQNLVDEQWGAWTGNEEKIKKLATSFTPQPQPQVAIDVINHTTAQIQMAFPLLDIQPEHVAYLDLLTLLLLGEQDGLLYKVAQKMGIDIKKASMFPMIVDGPGQLVIHLEISTHQVDQMWSLLLEQLNRLSKHPVPLRTLEQAKMMFEQKSILKTAHLSQYSKRFAFFALRWPNVDGLTRYNQSLYQVNPNGLMQYFSELFTPQGLSVVIRSSIPKQVDAQLWGERFKEQLQKTMNPQKIKYHKGFTPLGSRLGVLFHPMPNSSVISLQLLLPLQIPYTHANKMSLGHWMAAQMSLHQAHEPYYHSDFHAHAITIETTITHDQLEEALFGMIQRIRQTPIQSELLWSSHFLERARIKAIQNLNILNQHPWLKLAFLQRKAKLALNQKPLIDLQSRMTDLNQQSSAELIRWYTQYIQFAPALLTIVGDIEEGTLNRVLATFASLKDDNQPPLSAQDFTAVSVPKPMRQCRFIQQTMDSQVVWNRHSYLIEQAHAKTYAALALIEAIFKHQKLRQDLLQNQLKEVFTSLLSPLQVQMQFKREIPSFDIMTQSPYSKYSYTMKSIEALIQYLQSRTLTDQQLKEVKAYARTLQHIKLSYSHLRLQWLSHLWFVGIQNDMDIHMQNWFDLIDRVSAEDIQKVAQEVLQNKNMLQSLKAPPNQPGFEDCKKIAL